MRISFTRLSFILFVIILLYGVTWAARAIWFRPSDIEVFFNRLPYELAVQYPEKTSQVNIPQASLLLAYNSYLDEADIDKVKEKAFWQNIDNTLAGYTPQTLTPNQRFQYENLRWWSRQQAHPEGFDSFYTPYRETLDFFYLMEVIHPINSKEEAEAYISRVKRFKVKLDSYFGKVEAPCDSLTRSRIKQRFNKWVELPVSQHPLYTTFAKKAIAADPTLLNEAEAARLLGEVAKRIQNEISPLFQNIAESLDGKDFCSPYPTAALSEEAYKGALSFYSSFPISPDSLHKKSLEEWETIAQDSLAMLVSNSPALLSLPSYIDTLSSKLAYLKQISAGLFELSPQAPLTILPNYPLSDGLPIWEDYSFLLQDNRGRGKWGVSSDSSQQLPLGLGTAYASHIGFPGLHALAATHWKHGEPSYLHRQFLSFPAFEQGWAVYASWCISEELQFFSHLPAEEAAFKFLFRLFLLRCITDTGIHSQDWSYETAFEFVNAYLSHTEWAEREVSYMFSRPGYASAAWVGFKKLMALRKAYQEMQGADFILQDFHSQLLSIGPGTFPALESLLFNSPQ